MNSPRPRFHLPPSIVRSQAALSEIFEKLKTFPTVLLHGERLGGKSTFLLQCGYELQTRGFQVFSHAIPAQAELKPQVLELLKLTGGVNFFESGQPIPELPRLLDLLLSQLDRNQTALLLDDFDRLREGEALGSSDTGELCLSFQ